MKESSKNTFSEKWSRLLISSSLAEKEVNSFIEDESFGLTHSWEVFGRSLEVVGLFPEEVRTTIDYEVIEMLAIFHDIGKFFQTQHTLGNTKIAVEQFKIFSENQQVDINAIEKIIDGILTHDFYNIDIDPNLLPPNSIEGEIIRAADKMLENLPEKVDRYWAYGKERNITFYDPEISMEDRMRFNFSPEFKGSSDEISFLLSLISIKPEDFKHPQIQEEYRRWSEEPKKEVVSRILRIGEDEGVNIIHLSQVIDEYIKQKGL